MRTAATYRRAAQRADTHLRGNGLIPFGLGAQAVEQLADVARFLDSIDPLEIAAGALLEVTGHERAQEQLRLEAA